MKNKSLKEYIVEAKYDILVYLIFCIFIIILTIIFSIYLNHYLPIIISVVLMLFIPSKIGTYKNIKKIENYLINEKIINNIEKINFWNNKEYMLTDNYFIIVNKNKVYHFQYNEIKEIYKKTNYRRGGFNEYLYIKLKNNKEYKVLIWTTFLVEEEYKDISEYLLQKNKQIIYTK